MVFLCKLNVLQATRILPGYVGLEASDSVSTSGTYSATETPPVSQTALQLSKSTLQLASSASLTLDAHIRPDKSMARSRATYIPHPGTQGWYHLPTAHITNPSRSSHSRWAGARAVSHAHISIPVTQKSTCMQVINRNAREPSRCVYMHFRACVHVWRAHTDRGN